MFTVLLNKALMKILFEWSVWMEVFYPLSTQERDDSKDGGAYEQRG